jgi:hypothetical protein
MKTNEKAFLERLSEVSDVMFCLRFSYVCDCMSIKLHALSSGFKAYTSSTSERLTQVCRVACGGHGFLVASGLVTIMNSLDAACSAEGENSVLFQQTARYGK